jgi:hypothetical protein
LVVTVCLAILDIYSSKLEKNQPDKPMYLSP